MKKLLLVMCLIVLGFLGGNYAKRYFSEDVPIVVEKATEDTYVVSEIKVLGGHFFEMNLLGKGWIKARLEVSTPEDARGKVLEFLNASEHPIATLRYKDGDYWVIDLNVINEGQKVNLVEWLDSKNLIFR